MGSSGEYIKDNWHREAATTALRDAITLRRWGMRVTVYGGGTPGDYVLSYGLNSTNKADNANWLLVAVIGATWGGGGTVSGALVDCGTCDLSTNHFPTTGGTGTAGAVQKGNIFRNTAASTTLLGPDGGVLPAKVTCQALADAPGDDLTKWLINYATDFS